MVTDSLSEIELCWKLALSIRHDNTHAKNSGMYEGILVDSVAGFKNNPSKIANKIKGQV